MIIKSLQLLKMNKMKKVAFCMLVSLSMMSCRYKDLIDMPRDELSFNDIPEEIQEAFLENLKPIKNGSTIVKGGSRNDLVDMSDYNVKLIIDEGKAGVSPDVYYFKTSMGNFVLPFNGNKYNPPYIFDNKFFYCASNEWLDTEKRIKEAKRLIRVRLLR